MKSKKLFSHKNVCKVAIVLIILAHLSNSFSVRHKVKILDEIEAPSKANIYKLAYTDSIIGSVKQGEKVKIIGFYNKRYAFWAESESGIRGLIPIEELGYNFKAKNPSTKKSEIVSNVKCEGYPYKYDVVFDDGTKAKIKHENMEPQVSGKIRRHIISQSAGKYHILESKFNRKLLGKNVTELRDKKIIYVPFSSLNNNGLLKCIIPEYILIDNKKYDRVLIGISENLSFDCILNERLFDI